MTPPVDKIYSQAEVDRMVTNMYTQHEWDMLEKVTNIDKKLDVLLSEHTTCRAEIREIRKKADKTEHDVIRLKQFGIFLVTGVSGGVAIAKDLILPS